MNITIRVDEKRIDSFIDTMESAYQKLKTIRSELEAAHSAIRDAWEDDAALDFSAKFDNGIERLWDLIIAVDNMEQFLETARETYTAADNKVMSL